MVLNCIRVKFRIRIGYHNQILSGKRDGIQQLKKNSVKSIQIMETREIPWKQLFSGKDVDFTQFLREIAQCRNLQLLAKNCVKSTSLPLLKRCFHGISCFSMISIDFTNFYFSCWMPSLFPDKIWLSYPIRILNWTQTQFKTIMKLLRRQDFDKTSKKVAQKHFLLKFLALTCEK